MTDWDELQTSSRATVAAGLGLAPDEVAAAIARDGGLTVARRAADRRGLRQLHPLVGRVADRVLAAAVDALHEGRGELDATDVRLLQAWWPLPHVAARLVGATTPVDGIPIRRYPPAAIGLLRAMATSRELPRLLDGEVTEDVTALWPWTVPGPRARRLDATLAPRGNGHATTCELGGPPGLVVLQAGPPTGTTVAIGTAATVSAPPDRTTSTIRNPDVVATALAALGPGQVREVDGVGDVVHVHEVAEPAAVLDRLLGPGGATTYARAHVPIPATVVLTPAPATEWERRLRAWARHPRIDTARRRTPGPEGLGGVAAAAGIDLDLWVVAHATSDPDVAVRRLWELIGLRQGWVAADEDDVTAAITALDAAAATLAGRQVDASPAATLRDRADQDPGWLDRLARTVVATDQGLVRPVPDVAIEVLAAVAEVGLDRDRLRDRLGPLRSTTLASIVDRSAA